jgi:hypothetical protein
MSNLNRDLPVGHGSSDAEVVFSKNVHLRVGRITRIYIEVRVAMSCEAEVAS